jgi:hypothetical protein
VTVLQEPLEWSQDRPAWQRDALRRLVLHDELSNDDISALTDICKSAHGLAEQEHIATMLYGHRGRLPCQANPSIAARVLSLSGHSESQWSIRLTRQRNFNGDGLVERRIRLPLLRQPHPRLAISRPTRDQGFADNPSLLICTLRLTPSSG